MNQYIATETLAKIYVNQNALPEAAEIYEFLIKIYPAKQYLVDTLQNLKLQIEQIPPEPEKSEDFSEAFERQLSEDTAPIRLEDALAAFEETTGKKLQKQLQDVKPNPRSQFVERLVPLFKEWITLTIKQRNLNK